MAAVITAGAGLALLEAFGQDRGQLGPDRWFGVD